MMSSCRLITKIFKELSYVFIAAIADGTLAWKLRQPLILGYVVAGIAISCCAGDS